MNRCTIALAGVLCAALGSAGAQPEVVWEGRVRTLIVERDGSAGFTLDEAVAFPFSCPAMGQQGPFVGLSPGDVAADGRAIERMFETVQLSVTQRKGLLVSVSGCSANGKWYRADAVTLSAR